MITLFVPMELAKKKKKKKRKEKKILVYTYWINNKQVLIQCLLAVMDLLCSHISPPNTECLPLSEQGKCGNLKGKWKELKISCNVISLSDLINIKRDCHISVFHTPQKSVNCGKF